MPCLLDLTTTRCPLAVSAKGHQIACDFLKAALQSATKQRRLAAGLRGVEISMSPCIHIIIVIINNDLFDLQTLSSLLNNGCIGHICRARA